jgi:hypothetical protein
LLKHSKLTKNSILQSPAAQDFQSSTKEQWICNPRITSISPNRTQKNLTPGPSPQARGAFDFFFFKVPAGQDFQSSTKE